MFVKVVNRKRPKGLKGLDLLISDKENDLSIPDEPGGRASSITFDVLKRAQALGDRQALLDAGRHVVLFDLGKDVLGAIRRLTEELDQEKFKY